MPTPIIYDSATGQRIARPIAPADTAFQSGAIQSGALGAGSVNSGHLGADAVASGNIGDDAVVAGNIASGGVQSGNVSDGAVNSGNIASGQIGSDHLASGVTTPAARRIVDDVTYSASEALLAGHPVQVDPANPNQVRIAFAVSGGLPAIGVVGGVVASGDLASVQHDGTVGFLAEFSGTGISQGGSVFVTRSGRLSSTPPSASGNFQQKMGVGNASGLFLDPELDPIQVTA